MTKLLLIAVAALGLSGCTKAFAGESNWMGDIVVQDAGCVNNRTTATPFSIGGVGTKFTIQCGVDGGAAYVLTSQGSATKGHALYLPAGTAIVESIDSNTIDAGSYTKGLVAVCSDFGALSVTCTLLGGQNL